MSSNTYSPTQLRNKTSARSEAEQAYQELEAEKVVQRLLSQYRGEKHFLTLVGSILFKEASKIKTERPKGTPNSNSSPTGTIVPTNRLFGQG